MNKSESGLPFQFELIIIPVYICHPVGSINFNESQIRELMVHFKFI